MGSAAQKQEGDWCEIVLKFDGFCVECRGKVFAGSGGAYRSGLVKHLVCPPVSPIVREAYLRAGGSTVSPARWKQLCKQTADAMLGGDTIREVISEDVEAEACGAFGGMLANVMKRTRCTGHEAIEIVRRWKDQNKVVDEERFEKVNQSCRREQPVQLPAIGHVSHAQGTTSERGDGSPTTDELGALVDWDAEER